MSIGESIYTYLKTVTGVTDLVKYRIYPLSLPQGCSLPAITYEKIAEIPVHAMGSDSSIHHDIYRFHCWATTFAGAQALSAALITALRDKTGTVGSDTVQRIFFEDEYPLYESETETYHTVLECELWYD